MILILFFTLLLRIPSLLEPFWYGDEGVYMALGQALTKDLPLYSGAFDNKPPAIYLLSAFSMTIFGHSIWSLRFVLLLWVLFTQVVIYSLAGNLWTSKKAGLMAAGIFGLLTATPLIEGNIANGEIFFILFTSLGYLYGFRKRYFLAGVSFALAFLFKAPAVFDFFAFGLFILLHQKTDNMEKVSKRLFFTGVSFLLPLVLTALYFFLRGHFGDFYFAVLSSNVGYTDFGNRFLNIPNGLLYIKALGLGIISLFFLTNIFRSWERGVLKKEEMVTSTLILWLFFALYGSLFGGRNYSHYLIQIVPPVTLLLTGIIFKKLQVRLAVGALVVSFVITALFGFRTTYWKWNYYPNAFNYLVGKMSQVDFNKSFDRKISRNYTLAEVSKRLSDPKDALFIWANEPQIYFLANRVNIHRYTAAYHVHNYNGYQDVMEKLNAGPPKIIITETPTPYPFPALEDFIKAHYSLSGEFDDAQIFRLNSAF